MPVVRASKAKMAIELRLDHSSCKTSVYPSLAIAYPHTAPPSTHICTSILLH